MTGPTVACITPGHTWADVALTVVVLLPAAVSTVSLWLGTRQHRQIASQLPPAPD